MAMSINSNIGALNAQKNIYRSQNMLSESMQRLSSGLRINSAKDDSAGLAISQRMTSRINGMNMGIKNANDGISMAQTAESNLEEVSTALQRIRELAVQSSNGIYTSSDRRAYQKEVGQLQSEIGRIMKTANFNGVAVFNESAKTQGLGLTYLSSQDFQVNADSYNTKVGGTGTVSGGLDPNRIVYSTKIDFVAASANGVAVFAGSTKITLYTALQSANIFSVASDGSVLTGASTGSVAAGDVISVATQSGARFAINWVDRAMDAVNDQRATFGALQTRFESTVRNLQNVVEQTSSARSRLQDTDFASETAQMTRAQILQQAGVAMLAQAKQQPQSVLALLQ